MVFFICDKCGESLKKNQVSKHFHCSSHSFSCMDCQKIFDRKNYANHLKCISENEKYGGKNYVATENKGEVKQSAWTECVQKAIDNVKEKKLKETLEQIKDFSNIPRKEAKFINFLVNSFRVRERELCQKAWQAIDTQVKLMQAETKARESNHSLENGSAIDASLEKPKDSANKETKVVEDPRSTDEHNVKEMNFKWKKSIKRKLKEAEDHTMKLKRLRKEVIAEYRTSCQDGKLDVIILKEIFEQKLESAGVLIDGNLAKLK